MLRVEISFKGKLEREGGFLAIPNFSLDPYVEPASTRVGDRHPIRTLLQSLHNNLDESKKLELQQAVLKLSHTPREHCFHVPQLWCLSIGSSTFRYFPLTMIFWKG